MLIFAIPGFIPAAGRATKGPLYFARLPLRDEPADTREELPPLYFLASSFRIPPRRAPPDQVLKKRGEGSQDLMLFLVISDPRPEPPSSVTLHRQRYWEWAAPLQASGEIRSLHAKVGRGAVALFDVASNEQLHQRLNEWANIIPARFEVHALIDSSAARAFLDKP